MASLERRLGLFSVITISMSSMVGSGIFVLPGIAFAMTGPSVYLAFLLSAICILPAALSKAELATAMPTSGGTYVSVSYTHLRAHETDSYLVCRLLLEKSVHPAVTVV